MPFVFDSTNITSITTLHGFCSDRLRLFLMGFMSFCIPIVLANHFFIIFQIAKLLLRWYERYRFMLCCILNIACTELLHLFFWTLPKYITLIAGKWILGETVCKVIPFIIPILGRIEINTLVLLAVYKVSRIRNAFRPEYHKAWIGLTHILSLDVLFAMLLHGKPLSVHYYNPLALTCDSSFWRIPVSFSNYPDKVQHSDNRIICKL